MKDEQTSSSPQVAWPFDLRVFAVLAALWAVCLVISAFAHIGELDAIDPIETILGGIRFNGDEARLVLLVEAGIFAIISYGVFTHRRWGLLLALCYMAQVVMSQSSRVRLAYLPFPTEWMNVRAAASPRSDDGTDHAVSLYLRVRSDFDLPDSVVHSRAASFQSSETAREESGARDIAAMAGSGK